MSDKNMVVTTTPKVEVNIEANRIHAKLINGKAETYCFQLLNIKNESVEQGKYSESTEWDISLNEAGIYYVKVFCKKNEKKSTYKSELFDYYGEEVLEKFEEFCKQEPESCVEMITDNLPLKKMCAPYKDFAVHVTKENTKISKEFLEEHDFNVFAENEGIEIVSESMSEYKKNKLVFSGMMNYKNTFVCGEGDVKESYKVDSESVGSYSYVVASGSRVEIGNDYFGTGKLYCFESETEYIISNNYHLVLLLMKDLGIAGQLDIDASVALMCKQGQIFQQSMFRKREILGTYMLPVDEKVIIKKSGWKTKKKSIAKAINLPSLKINKDALLDRGIQEVSDNIKIVLDDVRLKNVVVDLTGGLDSRVVYGAATKFPDHKGRILINTSASRVQAEDPRSDLSIACKLNSVTKFNYKNSINQTQTEASEAPRRGYKHVQDALAEMMSLGVLSGYYYPYSTRGIMQYYSGEPNMAQLNGFYGEICCRSYVTRAYLSAGKAKPQNVDKLVDAMAHQKDAISARSYTLLREHMKEELNLLPGKSLLEKWELHYLFYRNRLHCETIWEKQKNDVFGWGPLQSKSLFRYKHMTFGKIPVIEEQLKVLEKIDPRFVLTSFDRDRDEDERLDFIKGRYDSDWGYDDLEIKEELDKLFEGAKTSQALKAENADQMSDAQVSEEIKQFDDCLDQRIRAVLIRLSKKNERIKREICLPIYVKLEADSLTKNEKNILYLKLTALMCQMMIFENY